uniref:Iron-binding zinc finger CDGSH type domain-containing protein n=1 Tax=Cairina moschata TaxID=8855 RepID=A0A8C3BVS8_CAIMO
MPGRGSWLEPPGAALRARSRHGCTPLPPFIPSLPAEALPLHSGTPPPQRVPPPCPPQPFCDGSHRTAAPGVSPLRFTAEADGAAPLCACKRTRTPPFCDGSHREQAAPPGPRP